MSNPGTIFAKHFDFLQTSTAGESIDAEHGPCLPIALNHDSNIDSAKQPILDQNHDSNKHILFSPHPTSLSVERSLLGLADTITVEGQKIIDSIFKHFIPYLYSEPLGCPLDKIVSAQLSYMNQDDSFNYDNINEIIIFSFISYKMYFWGSFAKNMCSCKASGILFLC